jgi:XTP/dITP diphosphohydrolase
MSQKLLFASNNSGKLAEVAALLSPLDWEVVSVAQVPELAVLPAPLETGETFQANAELKARYYAKRWSGAVLADDSGLEVKVLNGEPGVHSNRWLAGTDRDRVEGLLERLQQIGANTPEKRAARFVSCICWLSAREAQPLFFEGEVTGVIAAAPVGTAGFGYDPIFIPTGQTTTFADLGQAVKNTISHRARALQKLQLYLEANAKQT